MAPGHAVGDGAAEMVLRVPYRHTRGSGACSSADSWRVQAATGCASGSGARCGSSAGCRCRSGSTRREAQTRPLAARARRVLAPKVREQDAGLDRWCELALDEIEADVQGWLNEAPQY